MPRDVHTLVQPYQGLVVQVIDAADNRAELDAWLTDAYLPGVVRGPNAVATRFGPRPLPPDRLAHVRELEGAEKAVTVPALPRRRPPGVLGRPLRPTRRRRSPPAVSPPSRVQAAFVPTHHGTDDYTDELF